MEELAYLQRGEIILYPTDTIWGLGCDATNKEAIKKIIELKQRPKNKSILLLVSDREMLRNYVEEIPKKALELLDEIKEPLTIIYPKAKNLPIEYLSNDETIGIRIPKNEYCQRLIKALSLPLVSTSANISGEKSPTCFNEISEEIKKGVSYIANIPKQESTKHNSIIYIVKENNDYERIR
ncbi:MAG: threonylcarbamoyl-AMP synthase [Bacteroidales bacterium]|jgi:L-threonylcarbamoyladenylate synthase|nr:threonylcarbamoyl-AMP synthase [Bacteroidales bacterium]